MPKICRRASAPAEEDKDMRWHRMLHQYCEQTSTYMHIYSRHQYICIYNIYIYNIYIYVYMRHAQRRRRMCRCRMSESKNSLSLPVSVSVSLSLTHTHTHTLRTHTHTHTHTHTLPEKEDVVALDVCEQLPLTPATCMCLVNCVV